MSTLTVFVHEAKDVRSADPNGLSDPYALVFVGKNKPKKTKIIKKSLNPKWDESFEFPLTRHDKTLQVQVWDWDRIGSDDFLGLVHIDLSPCHSGQPDAVKAGWLKLQPHPTKKKIKVTGGINISVSLQEVTYSAASSKEVAKQVLGKINTMVKQGSTMWDISGVGAQAISDSWINKLPPGVDCINISFNQISGFPASMKKFVNLQQLFAAGNQISKWPAQACEFANLTEIEINGNDLRELPPQFGKLQKLEKLNAANNKISKLPQSLGYCYHLEELNLSGNELEVIPDALGNCYRLEVCDLSCNGLRSIPEEVTYCTRLIELNLGGNRLQNLPQAIGRLSRVVSLNLSDNLLKDLPVSIGYCAGLAQIGQGCNIDRNPLRDKEMGEQYRVGADRLYMYLEKRMFLQGSPQLPPFPNNGKPPYVPLPPIDGEMLAFGNQKAPSQNRNLSAGKLSAPGSHSPISLKQRMSNRSDSRGSGSAAGGKAAPTKEEKIEKIRTVAKAVIEKDIRPKLHRLRDIIEGAANVQSVQPHVFKVKSLKNDFEAIKTIMPAMDKIPPPQTGPNDDTLTKLKKVVGVILFEYDLVLSVSLTVIDVASSKDLVSLVGSLKRLKALLH